MAILNSSMKIQGMSYHLLNIPKVELFEILKDIKGTFCDQITQQQCP